MQIAKQFTVNAPQSTVWRFITSPHEVAACIPGCDSVEVVGEGTYRAAITMKVGPIKTTFHLTITTTEERPPEFAAYRTQGEEGGKASRLNATSTLTLEAIDDASCSVAYVSDIAIAGRLGKFGAGVMKKIADKEGEKFAAALRDNINTFDG